MFSCIAFIICFNDNLFLNECKWYISQLIVPDECKIEIIEIKNPKSICAGYNEAMHMTNAKYKVYLHQDTFIINKYFISDIITCFENDIELGMLGVLGTDNLPRNAMAWNSWNLGKVYACDTYEMLYIGENRREDKVQYAVAIDGMIMITCRDVIWMEEVFDGFDFYDISQCMEFLKKGYKIGVVSQGIPWCVHDCGPSKFARYDYYRKLFCNTYRDFFSYSEIKVLHENAIITADIEEKIVDELDKLVKIAEFNLVSNLIKSCKKFELRVRKLREYTIIDNIYCAEIERGLDVFTKVENDCNLIEKYRKLCFTLRRVEFGDSIAKNNLSEKIKSGQLTKEAIIETSKHCSRDFGVEKLNC